MKVILGRILATPSALRALEEADSAVEEIIARHAGGDWGELSEDDRRENDFSLIHGFRLLSCYRVSNVRKIWVITEADRSATTLLLPEEY